MKYSIEELAKSKKFKLLKPKKPMPIAHSHGSHIYKRTTIPTLETDISVERHLRMYLKNLSIWMKFERIVRWDSVAFKRYALRCK